MERELGFINDAEYRGKATPHYHDSKFHLVEGKPRFTHFQLSKVKRGVKIEKKAGLSPCSYNALESFKKTQLGIRATGFSKTNIPSFSEIAAKLKKYVPSPGHYDILQGEQKVYKPFSRKRR